MSWHFGLGQRHRYQYQRLEEGYQSIRVLRLHTNTSRLECSIKQVNILDGGYQALSYEWGAPETCSYIHVRNARHGDRAIIPLTTNLYFALKNLRDASAIQSKVFWIDQISIIQSDAVEKGLQVNLMGNIYRNAQQVITYLGPHAGDVDLENRALDILDRICLHFEPNCPFFTGSMAIGNTSSLPVREMPHGISEHDTA
jgi:hypothetical protein